MEIFVEKLDHRKNFWSSLETCRKVRCLCLESYVRMDYVAKESLKKKYRDLEHRLSGIRGRNFSSREKQVSLTRRGILSASTRKVIIVT